MEHAMSAGLGAIRANGKESLLVSGTPPPVLTAVTLYCHSYPYAQCQLELIDSSTFRLNCGMRGIPRHAYTEIALELLVDGEIKRFRHPVHVLEKHDESVIVALSFEVEPSLQDALNALLSEQQVSCVG